ncbi:hypothetical protein B0H14DRAFT_2556743 [Mycena olivaceomarginata]|nr:hypothetical protein B0H14DRAFT_2556743 [Mycena olivaceomarginata]
MSLSKVCTGFFDGQMAILQRSSPDLVVYCSELNLAVRIAWPTVGGHSVPAVFLPRYLERNEKYWPYFCAKHVKDEAVSSRIVMSILSTNNSKHTIAVCHYDPPRCQFYLHLTSLWESATLRADFNQTSQSPLGLFMMSEAPENVGLELGRPLYLPGYIGETAPQSVEQNLLARLSSGEGISTADAQELLVRCAKCGTIFLKGNIGGHCKELELMEAVIRTG